MASNEFKFDEAKFISNIESVKAYFNKFVGKPGYNPFFKLQHLDLFVVKFKRGERTKELFDLVASIRLEPPVVSSIPPEQPNKKEFVIPAKPVAETGVDIQTPKPNLSNQSQPSKPTSPKPSNIESAGEPSQKEQTKQSII